MFMATKTITIMEDAYEALKSCKKEDESFSDTIRRIAGKKRDLSRFFCIWSEEYADSIEKSIAERLEKDEERQKWREKEFA